MLVTYLFTSEKPEVRLSGRSSEFEDLCVTSGLGSVCRGEEEAVKHRTLRVGGRTEKFE